MYLSSESAKAAAGASPGGAVGGEIAVEGALNRKHEWESTVKKASNRWLSKWHWSYASLNLSSINWCKHFDM